MFKKILSAVMATIMVVGLTFSAIPVQAAVVTGNVKGLNSVPTMAVTELRNTTDVPVSAMTPLTEYLVAITCGDANGIDDFSEIRVKIYYDTTTGTTNSNTAWQSDILAFFRWTKAGGWEMSNKTGAEGLTGDPIVTSWEIVPADCVIPSMVGNPGTGTWKLAFKPGKLAKAAAGTDLLEWVVKAVAIDQSAASTTAGIDALNSMSTYAEVSTSVSSITFGGAAGIASGVVTAITDPISHKYAVSTLTNTPYAIQIQTAATWTSAGIAVLNLNQTPGDGTFYLSVDDAGDAQGHVITSQFVPSTATTITGHASKPATALLPGGNEDAPTVVDLYHDINLGTHIVSANYSGAITITVLPN